MSVCIVGLGIRGSRTPDVAVQSRSGAAAAPSNAATQQPLALRRLPGLLLLITLAVTGCGGPSDGRVPVAGEVLLDGQPLDRGSIEFHPQDASGSLTGGVITDGKFEIPAEQGAKPGAYQVRIFAAGGAVVVNPDEPPGPEADVPGAAERIPARFNVNSELQVEVSTKGNRDLRFDIEAS